MHCPPSKGLLTAGLQRLNDKSWSDFRCLHPLTPVARVARALVASSFVVIETARVPIAVTCDVTRLALAPSPVALETLATPAHVRPRVAVEQAVRLPAAVAARPTRSRHYTRVYPIIGNATLITYINACGWLNVSLLNHMSTKLAITLSIDACLVNACESCACRYVV